MSRLADALLRVQVYKKLERELHDKKREIASVIDVSNIAYEARDQARNEIAALRAQSDKEQATFGMEYREVRMALRCGRIVVLTRLMPFAAWEAHRRGPQGARGGAARRGGEDLRVRAAGGREAAQGQEQLGRGAREENQGCGG